MNEIPWCDYLVKADAEYIALKWSAMAFFAGYAFCIFTTLVSRIIYGSKKTKTRRKKNNGREGS